MGRGKHPEVVMKVYREETPKLPSARTDHEFMVGTVKGNPPGRGGGQLVSHVVITSPGASL